MMKWLNYATSGHKEINQMNWDMESAQKGYSSYFYWQIIENHLPSLQEPNMKLMHSNALTHTSSLIKKLFDDNGIPLADLPQSPDLDSFGNGQAKLEKRIYMSYPHF